MKPAVLTKKDMYERLARGEFGNTIEQWFDKVRWLKEGAGKYPLWGVRSMVGGGDPRSRLNVPTEAVLPLIAQWWPGQSSGFNLSPMIDRWAVLRGQVMRGDGVLSEPGLLLEFVPGGILTGHTHAWREGFKDHRRDVGGSAAVAVLRQYLWPEDYENLATVLDEYPGHVVEFTACDRAVGVIPNRNTVVWEVRRY